MATRTFERVEVNTSQATRDKFDRMLTANISRFIHAGPAEIENRLAELDREWNVERLIEVEAPLMIGLGVVLGLAHSPKWFGLSAFAAGMVILHGVQGWYPLLPVFQSLGFRSENDIEQERNALRALHGDQQRFTHH